MVGLDADSLALWSCGRWTNGKPSRIGGVSNDTRTLRPADLFVAIATAKRDGHDYLESALEKGASAALVNRVRPETPLPQLQVEDVGEALQAMARRFRRKWRFPVVGVTGSCGKTTCKDILATLLGEDRVLSTRGNLNNLIGVPMSILRESAVGSTHAVLEAGISEPGEMARLAAMIDPEYAVITAIGPAHLEDLGSEQAIAREKGMLAQGERVRQVFAGETCEPYVDCLGGKKVSIVKESVGASAKWSFRYRLAEGRTFLEQRVLGGVETFECAGVGRGLASNVALAIAVASTLGIAPEVLRERLATWRPAALRGEWRSAGNAGVYVDCYNANPLSMRDALETFIASARADSPRFYVIGCMEELGPSGAAYHEELGAKIPFRKQDFLLVIGDEAASVLRGMQNVGHDMSRCAEIGSIAEARARIAGFEGEVFLKGSRRYKLESILDELPESSGGKGGAC